MYRATAATYYATDPVGNMLMYNDASRLGDLLQDLITTQAEKDQSSTVPSSRQASKRLRLEPEVGLLATVGRRAYGRDMDLQRTVLNDLLEGAQDFTNCTVEPFASECNRAISMTVDRIREMDSTWKDVLAQSDRLQTLGKLVSTAMSKMIVDVEDMNDISEAKSERLKSYCDELAKLSDLFRQPAPDGSSEAVDTVPAYVSNWFKFQYLSQILDGNLADIKFLWLEGELSLYFEVDEIVDLIEALFAATDHRRNAIGEINRAGRRADLW
jgi:protein transport protein DSL1/ZW10